MSCLVRPVLRSYAPTRGSPGSGTRRTLRTCYGPVVLARDASCSEDKNPSKTDALKPVSKREDLILSREGADNRCTLRKLDPISVGIEHNGDPRCRAERLRRRRFADTGRDHLGMNLVHLENLKGDVTPTQTVDTRVDDNTGFLLQEYNRVARAERRTERVRLLLETDNVGIKVSVGLKIPHAH